MSGGDGLLGALDLLGRRRAPYAGALAAIAGDVLGRFPPAGGRPLLEIGAGSGQLRAWLPAPLRERTLHSEPSAGAVRALRARAPGSNVLRAAAETLPLPAGACGAVTALCVFDAVADTAAAAVEIGRVLAPGGRFVHLLDMATLLEQPFAKLASSGLVPIPNVFGDPGDHEWPLDVVLLERRWLANLLRFAAHAGHPFAETFAPVFAPFLAEPYAVDAATAAFKAVAGSGDRRRTLAMMLTSASRLSVAQGRAPVEPLPFHSGRYLQSVLAASFTGAGFAVELSEIVATALRRPAAPDEQALRYRSLCVGHERLESALPRRLLAGLATDPPTPGDGDILVEAGVFAFVARKPA
ncbi:MAG TPA: methyltransferase domain-containing protein [Polyangia bacterium]|jgi:SAM-dependent methyltransferase